jgi:hypothetical protein
MSPYLVRTIAAPHDGKRGPTVIYVAMFDTEDQAIKAVKAKIPSDWQVDDVIGVSVTALGARKIPPGTVEQL